MVGWVKSKLKLISAKAEAQASSLGLSELGKNQIPDRFKQRALFDKKKLVQEKANQVESFSTFSPSADTFSKSSQTCHNDEIPCSDTTALPRIFGSQLCYATKLIHHLSSSLPNLSTMNWVTLTEEDVLRDQAEEALNEQYDRKIAEFYEDAR